MFCQTSLQHYPVLTLQFLLVPLHSVLSHQVVKRKDTKFPHVYVTFVTPDDNGKEGLGWALIIIAGLGSLACCYLQNIIDETDFPDVCGSDNNYSEPSTTHHYKGFGNSSVQRSPSDGSNDSSSSGPINTSEFKAAIRNFDRQTKGLGSRVLRKNNGKFIRPQQKKNKEQRTKNKEQRTKNKTEKRKENKIAVCFGIASLLFISNVPHSHLHFFFDLKTYVRRSSYDTSWTVLFCNHHSI